MIKFKRNPHWYAKYLLYFERPQKAVDYLNEYFQQTYGTPFTKNFDEAYFLDSPLGFTFNPAMYNIFLLRIMNVKTSLAIKDNLSTNYGIVYQDICKWVRPRNAAGLLKTLNLEKKEEDELHEGSEERIIAALKGLLSNGWIIPREIQNLPLVDDLPLDPKYSGRLIYSPMNDYDMCYNPNLKEVHFEIFDVSLSEFDPENEFSIDESFWAYQLQHHPQKVLEAYLGIAFAYYAKHDGTVVYDTEMATNYKHFYRSVLESIKIIAEQAPDEVVADYPKYAGYQHVDDPREWLMRLRLFMKGQGDIDILGKRGK